LNRNWLFAFVQGELQIKRRSEERRTQAAGYSAGKIAGRREAGRRSKGDSVPWQRLMYELNELMEPDAVLVEELG
jgi:hypothetical protein